MKILFTDFDGVLHPLFASEQLDPMDPVGSAIDNPAVFCYTQQLADILAPHKSVGIIVHSSWRLFACEKDLRLLLGPLAPFFSGVTPRAPRYESIRWVVQQNKLIDFRILDDARDEFPSGVRELIVCDSELGIADRAVKSQVKEWLNGQDDFC